MKLFFDFGESVRAYNFKVINEREARASAGIMFLLGLLSLFSVYGLRTLLWAELFSITFIFEFFVRLVFSPRYAPYMLLASIIVHNQEPEWVEARPKKFAWILGMILGIIMTYYIVFDVISLMRFGICIICLILLFIESVFGICLGCLLYHKLEIQLKLCPAGVCKTKLKKPYEKKKLLLALIFTFLFTFSFIYLEYQERSSMTKVIILNDLKETL